MMVSNHCLRSCMFFTFTFSSKVAYIRFLGGSAVVPVRESVGVQRVFLAVTDEFGRFICSYDFEFRVNVATDESGTASKKVACSIVFILVSFYLQQLIKIMNTSRDPRHSPMVVVLYLLKSQSLMMTQLNSYRRKLSI